ncbi:DUF3631 domain-containing protein [Diaphorobacter sp. HDW4B]|uniref:DUF3631 domain-containing protein n=1 Tax=Diaphorobacter sp. HDW4B TaxID=2714925 RepID=UPI001408614C|nr:DUF3631 domain-containing protein [Diaphorobacter sp. HDW4B]QIL71369.1 DUF3631 domain-containing protein [Diaphorobacter sp. HDW4B]
MKPVANAVGKMFDDGGLEPCSQPVDKNALMGDLIKLIKKYVVISDQAALAVSLWIILSWSYKEFTRCPLLLINAPERECGKTQLLKVVEKLVCRPFETANITLAALFRMISNHGPTLLIDEADTFVAGKDELIGVVNKGYEFGGYVVRVENINDEMLECAFFVYGPKALAGIALERHLPDATMSRGIQVPMRRKTKDDHIERLRTIDPEAIKNLQSRILRFVMDHKEVLSKGWDKLPEQLGDRQQDNWEPLLAIAHCMGLDWYDKTVEAALAICVETSPPKSAANQLLEDIREVLSDYKKGPYIPTATLLAKLLEHPDMDWDKYNRGSSMSSRQLARNLSGYGVKPKTVRMSAKETPKGYEVRDFQDAFDRYLPETVFDPDAPEHAGPGFQPVGMSTATYSIPAL